MDEKKGTFSEKGPAESSSSGHRGSNVVEAARKLANTVTGQVKNAAAKIADPDFTTEKNTAVQQLNSSLSKLKAPKWSEKDILALRAIVQKVENAGSSADVTKYTEEYWDTLVQKNPLLKE